MEITKKMIGVAVWRMDMRCNKGIQPFHVDVMTASSTLIRCSTRLLRPAEPKRAAWTFLILPPDASAKLPSRGMVPVEGTLNGSPFRATLSPDGKKSHWMKVEKKLRLSAGAEAGDEVKLELSPSADQPEPDVPAELRSALKADAKAYATWNDITPAARRDWVQWIESAKKEDTRVRRIDGACNMLASGKRRVCCFDRSGYFSKGLSAPKAAE